MQTYRQTTNDAYKCSLYILYDTYIPNIHTDKQPMMHDAPYTYMQLYTQKYIHKTNFSILNKCNIIKGTEPF